MASLPGLGNSLDSRAERRSWARLSGCGVWSWAMVFSGIGCLQLGGCENHAVGPRLPPALQGTAPAVQAVCAIVGAGSLEYLRLRLRYWWLRGAGRHSCPFPLRGMAGLLQVQVQVCGRPLRKTHEKTRKKAHPWRATHVIAAYLSCPSIAAFFPPVASAKPLGKTRAASVPATHTHGLWHPGPGRLCIMTNLFTYPPTFACQYPQRHPTSDRLWQSSLLFSGGPSYLPSLAASWFWGRRSICSRSTTVW